jgi:hypothetical protein
MSKTFPKKIDKNSDVSFSSTFLFYRVFWVFLSDGSSKALQKTFCKKSCRKVLHLLRLVPQLDWYAPSGVGWWASGGESQGQGGDIVAGVGVCNVQFPGTCKKPQPGQTEIPSSVVTGSCPQDLHAKTTTPSRAIRK